MSWSIEVLDEPELLLARFTGSIDLEGFKAYESGLSNAASGREHYSLLFVCTNDLVVELDTQDLRGFAHRESTLDQDARRAIVAPDALVFGLSRLYSLESDEAGVGERLRVFRTIEEACDYLQIPRSVLPDSV